MPESWPPRSPKSRFSSPYGALLNFVGTATAEQVGRLWNPADRARLLQIRDRVDPTGLFATNIHVG